MALNFNVEPYYDDFDPNKNYHRILFKPGFAVQARELTQSQTILQNQISKFADHVFQKNTPISGAKLTLNNNASYIKLEDTYNGQNIDVTLFVDQLIQNAGGDVVAKVLAVAESSGTAGGDPNTLVVSYISGQNFQNGDLIYSSFNPNIVAQAKATNATGKSTVVSISEGVFYVVNGYNISQTTQSKYSIGHFVNVLPQTIIVDKYGVAPSVRVGLNVTETIFDYVDDVSLLDPADGAPNYQGPGADRYKISLDLETRTLTLGDDQGFIELMRIENGQIKKQVDSTIYATLDEYFAKRTFEESGDYVVNDFKLTPSSNTNNSGLYDLKIGKGIAYVHGYRLENQSEITLTSPRSREKFSQQNDSTYINYGNFVYTTSANNFFDYTTMPAVDLHLVSSGSVVSTNANTYGATLVASARVRAYDVYQQNGSTSGYVYRTYLTDVENKSLSSNATSSSNTTDVFLFDSNLFSASNNVYNNVSVSVTTGSKTEFRTVNSYNAINKSIKLSTALETSPTTSSIVTLNFAISDVESVVQMDKTSAPYKFKANSEISTLSKDNALASGNTVISETVDPELIYTIGYPYIATVTDQSYQTQKKITGVNFSSGSAQLTIGGNEPFQFLSSSASDYLIVNNVTGAVGSIANVTSVVLSGGQKIVTITVVDPSDLTTFTNATVITKVNINLANNSTYVLKSKNLVEGDTAAVHLTGTTVNTNTKVDTTYGHVYILNAGVVARGESQPLYISDVKRIVKIIDTLNSGVTATNSMLTNPLYDVTDNFLFDNGQRDSYYGHASIKLKPGAASVKGNLLVVLDYYDYDNSTGDGYFCISSYLGPADGGISSSPEDYAEIPSYTSKNGTTYSLRDCIDFRPTVQNAQANFTLITHNSTVLMPTNKDTFLCDYQYYLGRNDLLILSKDKNFEIIQGTPSPAPSLPSKPDGALVIANLFLSPYTAYVPGEAPRGVLPNLSLQKVKHRRWTMQDISDLSTRVNNIEYYTALNILEKNAQSLQIPDVNGLNRFKNGILVDDFSSWATADTNNPDYDININRREKKLSPSQIVENFPLQSSFLLNSIGSLNTVGLDFEYKKVGTTNMFMLPYTSANLVSQPLASNTVNINPFAAPTYEGVLTLSPPMDNWVDNTKQPDILLVDPDLQIYQAGNTLNTLSVGDWKTVPGTSYSTSSTSTSTNTIQTNRAITTTTTRTTTTRTYADLAQQSILGLYDKLPTYDNQNGFITDVSVQPYIRPQPILFRGKGLLINTPLKAWFDGVRVDNFITTPDYIELSDTYGTFKEDDVIGYTYDNEFYPMGLVAGVYNYPDTSNVRLYIIGNDDTSLSVVNKIESGLFDSSGNFVSNTAFGTPVSTNTIISIHNSGFVTSVGNNTTDFSTTPVTAKFFKASARRKGAFNDAYGIWSSANGSGALLTPDDVFVNYNFSVPTTGTYYLRVGAKDFDDVLSFAVRDSANSTISFTNINDSLKSASLSLTSGTSNVSFRMSIKSNKADKESFFALAISDKPWTSTDKKKTTDTTGNVIFSTSQVVASSNAAIPGVASTINLPGGGTFHSSVTQFSLCPLANATNGFYNGSNVIVTSTYVQQRPVVRPTSSANTGAPGLTKTTITSKATIISYTAANNTVYLDSPVAISFGYNKQAGGDITSQYTIEGTANNYVVSVNTGTPAKISSDETGSFYGVFNVPENTFRTGERVFRVDNRLIDTDPNSATTSAQGTFTASGLTTKSQALQFSPSVDSARNTFTRTDVRTNVLINTTRSSSSSTVVVPLRRDPVCQTFLIEKTNFPNGVFLSSIKLFFARKPTNNGAPVTLSIVGTDNGYPNGQTLDYSIVVKQAADIKVSTQPNILDPNSYTEFVFDSPIYVQSDVMYAILLQSPSNEYEMYIAAQNAVALPSSVSTVIPSDPNYSEPTVITKIGTAPYTGSLFESQNSITWTAEQGKALMFAIERCVFDTTKVPVIPFVVPNNLPRRKQSGQQVKSYFQANNVSNLLGVTSGENVPSHAYNITTTDFIPSLTSVGYTYRSVLDNSKSFTSDASVTPGRFGCPTPYDIYLDDGQGPRVLVANSTESFVLSATLSSTDNSVSPILSDDGTSLYNTTFLINNMELSNNSITLIDGGTGYNANAVAVTISPPDDPFGVQATASVNLSGNVIQQIYIVNPGSGYWQTPTINVIDADTRAGNSNTTFIVNGETNSSGGNAFARYVTKKVVLTPQNDSSDLRVYFSAYRPLGTNILVYYKVLNRNDTQAFEDSQWTLMTMVGSPDVYSKSRDDLIEFVAAPGTNNVADDFITYTSVNGQTYTSFSQFAIKVVLASNDKTKVPFLTDLRTIALPSGTGL